MEYISALVFPFILVFVEKIFPFPYLIEEIFKFFLSKKAESTKAVIILGFFFSISEAILYLSNPSFYITTDLTKSILRLLVVAPMHMTTLLVMYYFNKKPKYYYLVGLTLAILIHYTFNNLR